MDNKERKTLGTNVVPLNYRLEFEPNFKTFKFKGRETIKIEIKNSTSEIRLNAAELKIKSVNLNSHGFAQKAIIKTDEKEEQAVFRFGRPVRGAAELDIEFEGIHNDRLVGFYRSKYTHKGKEKYIMTTQLEAADARKAYPCFDEPEFKATYDISFLIDKELDGVSNMPVKKEENLGGGKKRVVFYTTPRMSSYLLYLGVGRFEFATSKYKRIDFRVITVEGKGKNTKMAMDFGKKFLAFFESYFGIDFPLPKMDLLAIPDFSAGAMENWGAITFREIALLGDDNTSTMRKQNIAAVIAHELSHQWFGDLVTMKWWDDLWLNESFATFMATKAVESVFPKWEYGVQDYTGTLSTALTADQFISTHPINVRVNEPDEIDEIFDSISYDKGGVVLAMLEDYAGKETFRKGLHDYLKKHSYSNATKYDLWKAIGKAVKKKDKNSKFEKVAMDWVDKAGYPIIEVYSGKNDFALKQRRYLLADNSRINDVWPIPVHYMAGSNEENFMFLDGKSARLKVDPESCIKLNYMQKGLYRVKYPDRTLNKLGNLIKSKKLSALDAWGIEKDLFSLAQTSRIKVTAYLSFVERYCLDGDYPLDSSVSDHLNGLCVLLSENKALLRKVKGLSMKYHRIILNRVGWKESKNERNVTTLLRSKAIASLGMNGDIFVLNRVRKMFKTFLATKKPLPKNLKGAIYSTNAWHGDESLYKKFIELYKKEESPEDKRRFLIALSNFGKPELARKALAFSLSKDVRLQDCFVTNSVVSANEIGKKVIWNWTRENWQTFLKRFSRGAHMLPNFVGALDVIDDEKTREEIMAFFSKRGNRRGDMERSLKQSLEMIDANIKLLKFNSN